MTVRLPAPEGDALSAELTNRQISNILTNTILSLLEMYSVVDGVFTEEDAFDRARLHTGLGRIYRAWKKCRTEIGGDGEAVPPMPEE